MIIDINSTYWLNKTTGVYKITSPSNKIYIGSSISINDRLTNYRNGHLHLQRKLNASFNKYTAQAHKFELLEICCKENVRERERFYCLKYDTLGALGLNLKIPHKGDGYSSISEETRKKLSEARIGEKNNMFGKKGELSPNFGKKMPKDYCQKISERVSGDKHPMYGKKHSEETRLKMRNSSKRISRGNHSQAKKVLHVDTNKIWDCAIDCARENNISLNSLYKCLSGKSILLKGYKYVNVK
jgi:group I intron endonuclease